MAELSKRDSRWNQVVIVDPEFLPGTSIYNIIKLLQKSLSINYIFLEDLEGAGTPLLFSDSHTPILKIDEFMKNVMKVTQFDWGDFFLFSNYPENWESFKRRKYKDIISYTESTVRAVDDTYIYVYTPFDEIVNSIKENYKIESLKSGTLDELDYPF